MPDVAMNAEFYVDEGEIKPPEDLMVFEEETEPQDTVEVFEEPKPEITEYVPGSNTPFVEVTEDEVEQKAEDVETDWEHDQDHSKFLKYFDSKVKNIPRHSGNTVLGCERAISFLKAVLNELSKALRSDLDGKIDEQAAEDRHKDAQNMIDRLEQQVSKLKGVGKVAELEVRLVSEGHCDVCNSEVPMWHDVVNEEVVCLKCNAEKGLEKTATVPKINVYVSAFERAVVGTIINSTVSAGRNIEETYVHLKNKYNFTPREELAIQQLVEDYGFPIFKDRGRLNENSDPASNEGKDWAAQYYA